MTAATLEQAESARRKLREQLAGMPTLRGIGIAVLDGGYGVKVNLLEQSEDDAISDNVDGVPVIVAIVGSIRPQ
jgi:hypothetical protein